MIHSRIVELSVNKDILTESKFDAEAAVIDAMLTDGIDRNDYDEKRMYVYERYLKTYSKDYRVHEKENVKGNDTRTKIIQDFFKDAFGWTEAFRLDLTDESIQYDGETDYDEYLYPVKDKYFSGSNYGVWIDDVGTVFLPGLMKMMRNSGKKFYIGRIVDVRF